MNVTDLESKCLAVLDEIERTGDTIVLLRRGKPIARLTGSTASAEELPQRRLRGTVRTVGDIVAPAVPRESWGALRDDAPPRRRSR